MKTMLQRLFPVVLGAAGFLLRLLQQETAFASDTGLEIPGTPISYAVALYLAAAGVYLLVRAMGREAGDKLDLAEGFRTPPQQMLPMLVAAAMLVAVGGGLLGYGGLRSGDALSAALGVVAVIAAVCLFCALTCWRRGGNCGGFLTVPALLCVVWLLITYRQYADDPVLEAFYVQILAIAAFTYGFYQVAAYGFALGNRRTTGFILPAAVVLGLTALGDALSLGLICLYVGCTVVLYGFSLLEKPPRSDG